MFLTYGFLSDQIFVSVCYSGASFFASCEEQHSRGFSSRISKNLSPTLTPLTNYAHQQNCSSSLQKLLTERKMVRAKIYCHK